MSVVHSQPVTDTHQSPQAWLVRFLESQSANPDSSVERSLLDAVLQRRFFGTRGSPHRPVKESEPFGKIIYYFTRDPSRAAIQKCLQSTQTDHHPVLLVPKRYINEATALASEEGAEKYVSILTVEGFVATTIFGIAAEEGKDPSIIQDEIIEIRDKRLLAAEANMSLVIELR